VDGPAPAKAALQGLCPRCGAKTLFRNAVAFSDKCGGCGLDYTAFNVGDGPVVFLTMGIGAIVVLLAVSVELAFSPGILIHALLWIPLTTLLVVLALRFAKGLLLALEYRNAAREGRVKSE
jgi:uncharacterized protein (DUF983 family)